MANTHETLTSLFTDIADAIRAKTGGTETIVADQFPEAIAGVGGAPLIGAITVADGTTTVTIPVNKKYEHLIFFAVRVSQVALQTLIDEYEEYDTGWQIAATTREVVVDGAYCGGAFLTGRSSNGGSVRVTMLNDYSTSTGNQFISFSDNAISVSVNSRQTPGASKFAPGDYVYIAW